jgi:hypothetical protein
VEGGAALSSPTLSGQRRPLAIAVYGLGAIAALPVVATLVLLAIDGHPEGLLCIAAGAAVPFLLWGPWRLTQRARVRLRPSEAARIRNTGEPVPTEEQATANAEVVVFQEPLPASDPRHPGAREYSVRFVQVSPQLPPGPTAVPAR